jgi:hypothetical protein
MGHLVDHDLTVEDLGAAMTPPGNRRRVPGPSSPQTCAVRRLGYPPPLK